MAYRFLYLSIKWCIEVYFTALKYYKGLKVCEARRPSKIENTSEDGQGRFPLVHSGRPKRTGSVQFK